jgi:hypothetical protein
MSFHYHMKNPKIKGVLATFLFSVLASTAPAQTYTPAQIRQSIKAAGGAEPFMRRLAESSARLFPRLLDSETEGLMAVQQGRSLVYQVRLVNYSRSEIKSVEQLKSRVTGLNASAVCSAPIAKILITEYGASYKYMVYSKTKEYLFEYTVDQKLCQTLGLN